MLNRFALRTATVRALRGATIAGGNVRDSEIGPIDEIGIDQPHPVIAVYAGDSHFITPGRDLFATGGDSRHSTGFLRLDIDILITQRMTIDDKGTLDVVQPSTDASLEFNLDVIHRQIVAALSTPRPDAVWPEMWRRLVMDVAEIETKHGNEQRGGVRLAGRQLSLQVKMYKEPPPGTPLGPLWTDFLALCEGEPDMAGIVPVLRGLLAGEPMTDYEAARTAFTLTAGEAASMLLQ